MLPRCPLLNGARHLIREGEQRSRQGLMPRRGGSTVLCLHPDVLEVLP